MQNFPARARPNATDPRSSTTGPVHPSLRTILRTATDPDHRAIDRRLSGLDLADPLDYRRFLRIQLAALTHLSTASGDLDRDDVDALIGCLRTDLCDWGPPPLPALAASVARTPFTDAGVAYVVRGSRLGAAVLVTRVGPLFPIRYLSHRPSVSWTAFLARLAELDARADRDAIDDLVAAARATFAVFSRAARVVIAR